MNSAKQGFINEIKLFSDELNSKNPRQESLEWYLLNNLKNYLHSISHAQSSQDIIRATKIFSRFCVESMDWNNELYKKCSHITHMGLQFSKESRKL